MIENDCVAFSYHGDNCELIGTSVTCVQNPCHNNGKCLNDATTGYTCSCLTSFTGIQCETELQPSSVCREFYYGDNCTNHCQTANDCERGHYTCDKKTGEKVCIAGYKGTDCKQRDIVGSDPECPSIGSCKNGGDCFNNSCCCEPGYDGVLCQNEVIECSSNPCANGETCKDLINGYICQHTQGKRKCDRLQLYCTFDKQFAL